MYKTFKFIGFWREVHHAAMSSPSTATITFTLQNTLHCHTGAINRLAISPDKTCLISIGAFSHGLLASRYFAQEWLGDDSRTVLWSIASGEKLFEVEQPFNGPATAVSWASRDSSRFVIGFASGDIHLFSSEGEKVITICGPNVISFLLYSRTKIAAHQGGRGLLKILYTMKLTTRLLLLAQIQFSCGKWRISNWFRFFHCRLFLGPRGMESPFNFVTMGRALLYTI